VAYEVDLFGRVRRSIEAAGRTQTRLPRHVMVCGCWSLRRRPEPTLRYARSERRSISRTIRFEVVKREADISETRYDAGGGSRFEVERVQLWSPRSQRPSSIARRSTQRSKCAQDVGEIQ
jgi:hypothetical protein